jgi:hypothetical protein
VLLADRTDDRADIAVIESEAAALGAVLAIVPAIPGSGHAVELQRHGWSIASDWYLGWPLVTTAG